jgi:hypothetical protein
MVTPPNPAMAPTVIPPYCAIQPVFHVSQLKDFIAYYTPVLSKLYVHIDFSQQILPSEALLERRLVKKGNSATPQVCVQWIGLPDTTWED